MTKQSDFVTGSSFLIDCYQISKQLVKPNKIKEKKISKLHNNDKKKHQRTEL